MNVERAYNHWAAIYDTNENKTRDLDKVATQTILYKYPFQKVLELGCGTGKNTEWLATQAEEVIALDFSAEMLAKARAKISTPQVHFRQIDLKKDWHIPKESVDIVTVNLVLEHLEDLRTIFEQAYQSLHKGGHFFICELHPFKQYMGSKARFETANGVEELEVYTHHVSDFLNTAKALNFNLLELEEWFDEDNKEYPRLLSLMFKK